MSRTGGSNAARLSKTFGTEHDKWNCPFYQKIGACRHGDRCARNHVRPSFSQTLSIPHMYIPPQDTENKDEQEAFENFFEDILDELKKYGTLVDVVVVQNLGEHMNGNVYVKYNLEDEAKSCVEGLKSRYYNGILLQPGLSPVSDFREARCRQHEDKTCDRGGYCNFMHLRKLPRWLQRELDDIKHQSSIENKKKLLEKERGRSRDYDSDRRSGKHRSYSNSRSRSPSRDYSFGNLGADERRREISKWNQERELESNENDN